MIPTGTGAVKEYSTAEWCCSPMKGWKDNIEYPKIEEIKNEWNEMHLLIREGLAQLSPNALNKKPPANLNEFWDTVGEMWAFLNHHQAYHIGQIGILRRGFGKEPMSYN